MNHSIHQLLARACFHAHIGLAAACLATLSPQSNAQVSLWNGTSGLWTDPANWQGGLVPNSPTSVAQFDAQGIYAITHPPVTTALLGLNLLNQTSLLNLQGGSIINVGMNGIRNDSFILLNSTNSLTPTQIFATEPFALTGSGFLSLNAPAGDLEAASLAAADSETVILHAAPHVVRGTGTIHANLHNNSLIEADLPQRTLRLATHPKFNSGTISAINGAILRIESPLVQSGTGVVRADNSLVQISAPISNGSLVASGSAGMFRFSSGTRLDNVSLSGEALVEQSTTINGRFTNNGSIRIPPMSSNLVSGATFSGSPVVGGMGEIVLMAGTSGTVRATAQFGSGFSHLAGHTIRGEGVLGLFSGSTNYGTIVADVPGKELHFNANLIVNSGTIAVRNDGRLRMQGQLYQTSQGEVLADNCTLLIPSLGLNSIQGGYFRSSGDLGLIRIASPSSSITLIDVTIGGSLHFESGTLYIRNTLTNTGIIVVALSDFSNARITANGLDSIIFDGTGTIVLNNYFGSRIEVAGDFLLNGPLHTIRGEGSVTANLRNEGKIVSDRPGKRLQLSTPSPNGIHNSGDLIAENGSELFTTRPIVQAPDRGRIIASGGVVIPGFWTSGGSMFSDRGGIIRVSDGTLERVRSFASIVIPSSKSCGLRETFENNGTITINETGTNNITRLNLYPPLEVSGTGRLVLNSTPEALGAAVITNSSSGSQSPVVLPEGQTLAGNGRMSGHFVTSGTIAPGLETSELSNPIGLIDIPAAGSLSLTSTSIVDLQITGAEPHEIDRLTSQSPINLDGTLRIALVDGFVPTPGDSWTVVTGSPVFGAFSTPLFPTSPNGTAFRIVYTADRIVLEYYCIADINSDGGVDGGDIEAFFGDWEASDTRADVNNDGGVDGADIEVFFNLWERGGC